ncbi:MAG: conjugal transfer protein TraX [Lachnospiraceae bacterium]|nr:conjugal transfer protein TraX [Lachnospiraceae bacterium]
MENNKGLNANALKTIAVITMLIDHIGASVIWEYVNTLQGDERDIWNTIYMIMRFIGRIAFPIYCFFIVEGLEHTRSVKKYITRLAVFAFISEIPFDYAIMGGMTFKYQNVFFTLTIGLLCIWCLKEIEARISEQGKQMMLKVFVIFIMAMAAELLKTDYSGFGVVMIALLYLLRKQKKRQCITGAIGFCWEVTAIFSFVLIYFYNGQKGRKINKYFFYAFYPVHLAILATIKMICFG